jgi:hypothetical protein
MQDRVFGQFFRHSPIGLSLSIPSAPLCLAKATSTCHIKRADESPVSGFAGRVHETPQNGFAPPHPIS